MDNLSCVSKELEVTKVQAKEVDKKNVLLEELRKAI